MHDFGFKEARLLALKGHGFSRAEEVRINSGLYPFGESLGLQSHDEVKKKCALRAGSSALPTIVIPSAAFCARDLLFLIADN
jgi:hypothetical protein